jgi:microcystin-dependent protein
MATVTPGKIFTSNEIVTPANLNLLGTPTVALADGEVTAAKIAADAVTTAKILDANVTTAKIANAAVTQEKLAASVTFVPAGAIMAFAMNSAPSGWLAANGQFVSRSGFSELWAAIGTTYGAGDGTTTFNLPDLRGYFVRGAGTNGDGAASGTFGAKQSDDNKSHTHTLSNTSSSVWTVGGNNGSISFPNAGVAVGTATINTSGGSEARPKNIALLYCIKF